jgi:hypothetical protein
LIRLGADDPFREPEHPRRDEYRASERELMRLLGLCIFTDCSPLHRRCPPSPGLAMTWPRARDLRLALLEAVKQRQAVGQGVYSLTRILEGPLSGVKRSCSTHRWHEGL